VRLHGNALSVDHRSLGGSAPEPRARVLVVFVEGAVEAVERSASVAE
jgi:hypothetical protein